jgi:4-amino-4-deoxy-L-arabinose transferase-like glycosyltransferase
MTRPRAAWLLALYCAIVFFVNLDAAPLTDVDEGAFSEATREMLARGDYVTTWLNGELRFDKPVLTYWAQAVPVALVGPRPGAFRFPSALAACLWAWLLYRFARR